MKNNSDLTHQSGTPPSSMGGSNDKKVGQNWHNNNNNKKKKEFTGVVTDPVLKGKVITQNNSKDASK